VTAANPSLALFVLGLAVTVLAVRRNGVDRLVATILPEGHGWAALLAVACIAAVAANLLWRRALNGAAPSARNFSALGAATAPLTLVAGTTALWAVLQV
jgi:arsenical pump membrane protein